MDSWVQIQRHAHVGCLTLARPEALNALNFSMIQCIEQQLTRWHEDPSVLAVVIDTLETKAFCAGGDVRWVYQEAQHHLEAVNDFFFREYRMNALLGNFSKPIISLMNGLTMGGGVGLGMHVDYPIATEHFIFAMPETFIGLFPDVGASYLLSRLPQGLGMYLGLTGHRLSAADAHALGLVRSVIPSSSLPDVRRHLWAMDASLPIHEQIEACLHTVRIAPGSLPVMNDELIAGIEQCFMHPHFEGIIQSLLHRNDAWARETLQGLRRCSPTSLKVTFQHLQEAEKLDLKACLKRDYQLVQHFLKGHDFYEGVRALLIDKDKNPQWQPATWEEVTEDMILAYWS